MHSLEGHKRLARVAFTLHLTMLPGRRVNPATRLKLLRACHKAAGVCLLVFFRYKGVGGGMLGEGGGWSGSV